MGSEEAGLTLHWVVSHSGEGRSLRGTLSQQIPSLKKIESIKAKALVAKEAVVVRFRCMAFCDLDLFRHGLQSVFYMICHGHWCSMKPIMCDWTVSGVDHV